MPVYEFVGFETGVSRAGVNYLQPQDAFQEILNGFIYRQVLQSRMGFGHFAPRLADETRVFGIFEHQLPDSTRQLLAIDQNFLYKFNTGTRVFDPIPFGGSMAGYTGFGITAKDLYVSGVSYPFGDNSPRFVFCGEGITPNSNGSAVFFYDGTNVLDYTDVTDNPDYAAPPQGALNSACYCLWFNERINFIVPNLAGIEYNQGVLYSGIRTASGNGDKFNVAGSGLFQADTYQNITGATILGQILALNFDRMAYTLEKTRDAFNPYFGRVVPGVLGTNAKFSAVSYYDTVRSIGKTGIIGTDGRQDLRIDNKIPYFTADEIDQTSFNLTYGGFDRLNNQFLWAYKESEVDSETQTKVLVANYEENTWSVFDQRFCVFGQTEIGLNLNWDDIEYVAPDGNPAWDKWDDTTDIWDRIGLGQSVQKTLAGDDFGFIYELNQDFDDYVSDIIAITPGATTTLTISASGFLPGDLVAISGVLGMTQINNYDPETNTLSNELYEVISATNTSVVINVDSTLFDSYVSGGTLVKVILFNATTIPFNPFRAEGLRVFVSHIEFYIECNGGSLQVSMTADQQSIPFKEDVLVEPTNTDQVGEWITVTVDQEANFITFILKQQKPSVQLRVTSMRVHCEPGGKTSG